MMADDPRHGANAGYVAGCRERCCRDAAARYQRGIEWDHLNGRRRTVPIVGAERRIEALQALGWSLEELSIRAGKSRAWLHVTINANRSGMIYRRNHDLIAALYDELSMTLPNTRFAARERNRARRKGFRPPLAWDEDNIDNPDARPRGAANGKRKTDVDPVAVERAMAGDRIQLTRDERYEVVARLRNMGRSHGWIEEHTVITKPERYIVRRAS